MADPRTPDREPEPSYGPDEEGDVTPPEHGKDRAAWVQGDDAPEDQ